MVELRTNLKTSTTSWGFTDGTYFYPFGNTDISKALATFALMDFKAKGHMVDMTGEPLSEWTVNES